MINNGISGPRLDVRKKQWPPQNSDAQPCERTGHGTGNTPVLPTLT